MSKTNIAMASEMKLIKVKLSDIKPHPDNEAYFPTTPRTAEQQEALEELKQDIADRGLQQPLQINWKTKHILSGHRRYKILKELKVEEAYANVTNISPDDELEWLIADNTERQDVDVFSKMKFVKYLRDRREWRKNKNNITGKTDTKENGKEPANIRDAIVEKLNTSKEFVSMSYLFNKLNEERQKEVQDWFYKQTDENGKPSNRSLHDRIRDAAGKHPIVLNQKEAAEINNWAKTSELLEEGKKLEKDMKRLRGSVFAAEAHKELKKVHEAYLKPLLEIKPSEESEKQMERDLKEIYAILMTFTTKFAGKYELGQKK